jgi:hypothetical protein
LVIFGWVVFMYWLFFRKRPSPGAGEAMH